MSLEFFDEEFKKEIKGNREMAWKGIHFLICCLLLVVVTHHSSEKYLRF